MWLDDVSGLYHVRARTYDAATGRFLSRDPVSGILGTPESMNPYVFCNNNGRVWMDPTGEISLAEVNATVTSIMILASRALPAFGSLLRAARFVNGFGGGVPKRVVIGMFQGAAGSLLAQLADGKSFDGIGANKINYNLVVASALIGATAGLTGAAAAGNPKSELLPAELRS